MRAAVYYANDDVRVEEWARPEIGPGELLLCVRASGICGSDVMEWYRKPRAPIVLGHEVAGVVDQLGQGVDRFAVGDRVVATHHVPCDACRYCLTDRHSVCRTLQRTSFDPGGFAEFVRLSPIHVERGTFALPDAMSFEEGTFVEPLACVVRGQAIARLRSTDSVAVLGAGLSGLLHIQLARSTGVARIFATDLQATRCAAAEKAGADLAVPADAQTVQRIVDANQGHRVERAIVCAASASAMQTAFELVDDGGTVLLFAPLEPEELLPLAQNELWRRCVSIVHSYAGPPAEMRVAIELLAQKRIDVRPLISHRLPLADTAEGFRLTAAADDSLKVIVDPTR